MKKLDDQLGIRRELSHNKDSLDGEDLPHRVRQLIINRKSTPASSPEPNTPDPGKVPMSAFKMRHIASLKNTDGTDSRSSTETIDDDSMVKIHEQVARLTREQRSKCQETYREILESDVVRNGKTIMLKYPSKLLFADFPHYKSIWPQFRAIPDSSLMSAEQLGKHAITYMGGLRFIMNSMDDDEKMDKSLRKIAHAHIKWGIYKSHIMHMLPAVLEVMDENTHSKLDQKTKDAWTTLFDVIANLIDIYRVAESKTNRNNSRLNSPALSPP